MRENERIIMLASWQWTRREFTQPSPMGGLICCALTSLCRRSWRLCPRSRCRRPCGCGRDALQQKEMRKWNEVIEITSTVQSPSIKLFTGSATFITIVTPCLGLKHNISAIHFRNLGKPFLSNSKWTVLPLPWRHRISEHGSGHLSGLFYSGAESSSILGGVAFTRPRNRDSAENLNKRAMAL